MTGLKKLFQELLGLFVDDAGFAVAILVWVSIVGLALPMAAVPPTARAWLLGGGLIAILVESVLRRSGR